MLDTHYLLNKDVLIWKTSQGCLSSNSDLLAEDCYAYLSIIPLFPSSLRETAKVILRTAN